MLADQLRRHEAHRLIGNLIFGKIAWAVGQRLQHAGHQLIETFLFERRDGDDLLELMQGLELRDQREQLTLVGEQINFVEQQENRRVRFFRQVEDEAVISVPLLLGIDNHENQFATFERLAYLGHHLASERRTGAVNSGRVDENDLSGLASFQLRLLLGRIDIDDAKNAVARGLRLGRNDGQLLADQRIQQRALARIGAAEDANESGVKGHGSRLLASGYWPPAESFASSPFARIAKSTSSA